MDPQHSSCIKWLQVVHEKVAASRDQGRMPAEAKVEVRGEAGAGAKEVEAPKAERGAAKEQPIEGEGEGHCGENPRTPQLDACGRPKPWAGETIPPPPMVLSLILLGTMVSHRWCREHL